MVGFIIQLLLGIALKILEWTPEWLFGKILDRYWDRSSVGSKGDSIAPLLYAPDCGDKAIDLADQRLLISSAFGTYFAGLLEREQSYVSLKGQVVAPVSPGLEPLDSLQRVYRAIEFSRGPRVIIIAAEGGMGKSTLAARIVRCLHSVETIDLILGDSAKSEEVDPATGHIRSLAVGYYNASTFYKRLCAQLGLPYSPGRAGDRQARRDIRNRLDRRRAVIVVDNLEVVEESEELIQSLRMLATRDTRIIVTTRKIAGQINDAHDIFLVHVKPLDNIKDAKSFLQWHIDSYSKVHPDLERLKGDLRRNRRVKKLIDATGGIPLLMQILLSSIARSSWSIIDDLPSFYGEELLNFLYGQHWEDLGNLGATGLHAQHLAQWVAKEQYRGRKISFSRMIEWAEKEGIESTQMPLQLLQERFLIINYDLSKGNFAVFPSFIEFMSRNL